MSSAVTPAVRSWRNALFVVFAACGFALAGWVSRTPEVRDQLGASTAQMGWLIFAIAGGAIVGLTSASWLLGRLGARRTIQGALALAAVGLIGVGIGTWFVSYAIVLAGLAVFGLGFGTCDVSMNVVGAASERALGRTVMPLFHATYSVGTLTGAGLGVFAAHLGIPVVVHLSAASVALLLLAGPATARLPVDVAAASRSQPRLSTAERLAVWRDPRTLFIGLLVLAMGFAEGAAEDWLPLAMVDGYGVSATVGAALFGVFVTAMTLGRLAGGRVLDRFGRVTTMRGSAAVAAIGLVLTIFGPGVFIAGLGVALWGLGTSLGLPVGMSSAADDPRTAAARVSAAATVGYGAFLIGPPALAFLGEHVGLLHAFIVVLALVIVSFLLAPAARRPPVAQPGRAAGSGEAGTGELSAAGRSPSAAR